MNWQDSETAAVVWCRADGGEAYIDMVLSDRRPEQCPNCGRWLTLLWDVRIEESTDPPKTEAS